MTGRFKQFIDVATLCVITTGLYFAYDQAVKINESIITNNQSMSLTAWSNISTFTMEVDKILIEHPDAQKYLYNKIDIDHSNADYQKVYAIAIMMIDYFDYVASFSNSFVGKLKHNLMEVDIWNNYFKSTFETSPIMCRIYLDNIENYGRAIKKIAEPTCRASQAANTANKNDPKK